MLELLHHAFGWVCGQNLAHTWAPGGVALPVCQRCTGVYVGACVSALLHLAWRPAPRPRWLWLNGAFLLFILPSGFYWIPQNPELRCASGILFGFGLVTFLELPLPRKSKMVLAAVAANPRFPSRAIAASLLATLALTPLLAEYGNRLAAGILTAAGGAGALTLVGLVAFNLFSAGRWLGRRRFAPPA